MLKVSQAERDDLIRTFWEEVRLKLIKQYGHSEDQADLGILRYRRALDAHQVGDLLYHQGEAWTAEIVDGLIKQGMPG
jgi:hypothetical protein